MQPTVLSFDFCDCNPLDLGTALLDYLHQNHLKDCESTNYQKTILVPIGQI